jgi:bifunctional non-homologous end joining protein LigD
MKAKLVDSMPSGNWIYEIKFDGYRALALRDGSETRVLSRNQKDLGGKFPEVKDSIAALDVSGLSTARSWRWTKGPLVLSVTSRFGYGTGEASYSFLCLRFAPTQWQGPSRCANRGTKGKLEELLKKPPCVIRYSVSFTKDVKELLSRARELGLKGLIGKRGGSRCRTALALAIIAS